METRVCPIPTSLSYTSAPSSPGRSPNTTPNAYFSSVPTSPSRYPTSLSRNPSGYESEQLKTPGLDNLFKFGSLVYEEDGFRRDMPIMAYADELFRGGKMLPLKLPPRLQPTNTTTRSYMKLNSGGTRIISSASSSPGSRSVRRRKIPFGRRPSLRNDEFDPFVVALEKVKENHYHHHHHHHHHRLPRRSQSLSPLKWGWGLRRSKSMGPDGPSHLIRVNGQSPIKEIPMVVELSRPDVGDKGVGVDKAEARRQRIKRFFLKSASFGWKAIKSDKEERRAAMLCNPHESMEEATTTKHGNAVGRISRGLKSLVRHKPRLFSRSLGLRRSLNIS